MMRSGSTSPILRRACAGTTRRAVGRLASRLAVLLGFVGLFSAFAQAEAAERSFRLLDHRGAPVTERTYLGKPSLVFFGFTHCPSICPTTLSEITLLLQDLGPLADRLNVLFVSVDPERDTHAILREYLSSFDARIQGLTGPEAEIDAMVKAFGAHAAKVPLGEGGYTVDHSMASYLMTSDWKPAGFVFIGGGANSKRALSKLKSLIAD